MCNAVVSSITNEYGSDKIKKDNCSDETNPNIIMTDSNIESVTRLYLGNKNISKISGIEYFNVLTYLNLERNQISDISPLGNDNLNSLVQLYLRGNRIIDLAPLSNLENLRSLSLANNSFTDITPILLLDLEGLPPFAEGDIPIFVLSDTTHDIEYTFPTLFLLFNGTLDITPVAEWVTIYQDMIRQAKASGLIKFDLQNAKINEDGKGITILDTTRPAIISVYGYDDPEGEGELDVQLTVTYEEPVGPVDPTDPTNDPAVPNTGNNTQESGTAILTATLCILSGIILTAIPMAHIYHKTREQ